MYSKVVFRLSFVLCVVVGVLVVLVSVLHLGTFQQTQFVYRAERGPNARVTTFEQKLVNECTSSPPNLSVDHLSQQTQLIVDNRVVEVTNPAVVQPTFVLTLDFHGQQGSAALCLSTLQCFLGSIYKHFYVVEPYLVNSHMKSHTVAGKSSMNFSSFFNLDIFNSESRKVGYTEMASMNEFQRVSSNYKFIILVVIAGNAWRVAWSADKTEDRVNCFEEYKHINSIVEPFRTHIQKARQKLEDVRSDKCIVRMIQLLTTKSDKQEIPRSRLKFVFDFIFDTWSPQDVLLVFAAWPKSYLPVYQPLNGVHCLQERETSHNYIKSQFHPSERLIQNAEMYERVFLGNANRLAIMLRVERVVTEYLKEVHGADKPKTLEECFQRVLTLKSQLEKTSTQFLYPLVTLDIGGKYGTQSFKNRTDIETLSIKTLENLYSNKLSMEEWENSFVEVSGVTHPGYIAALQRLLASRADCLVLVGGGDFQALAVQDYLEYHKSRPTCIHLVCCMSSFDEVQATIKQFAQVHQNV